MSLFAKPEFVWKEPRAFRRAVEKCIQLKYPQTKPHVIASMMGLFLALVLALPFWLNWVLPAQLEWKIRHGFTAIPGSFLSFFVLFYSIHRLGVFLPNEVRVFKKQLVVTNERAYSFHEIKSCMIHDFGEFLVIVLDISGKYAKRVGAPPDLNIAALREIFERHSIEIKSTGQKSNWPESPAIQQLGELISEIRRNKPRKKSKRATRPFTVRSLMLWVLLLGTLFGTCLRLRNDLENGLALFNQQLADQQKMIATALEVKQSSGENWPRIKADYIRGIRNQDDLIDQTKNQLIIWLVAAMFLAVMAYFLTPVVIFVWLKSPKRHDDPKQVEEAHALINPTELK